MKALKYLAAGAMLAVCSVANAQDIATDLANLEQVVKSSNGDASAYKANLKTLDKLYKKDPEALTKISKLFYVYDDTLNCRAYAEKAITIIEKKKMTLCEPYIILGDLHYINNNPGDAAIQYEFAKRNDPKNAKAYEKYAGVYRKANPAEAVANLKELEAIDPSYPANAVAAGFYYDAAIAGQKTWGRTLEYFQKEDINKFREEDYPRYVYVLYLYNRYDKAIEVADKGLAQYPNDVTCWRYKMYSQVMKAQTDRSSDVAGLFNGAVESSKKMFAAEKYQEYADDYRMLGEAYCGLENWTEAEKALSKSLALNADQPGLKKSLGDIEFSKGNFEAGAKLYQEYFDKFDKVDLTDYYALSQKYDEKIKATEDGAEKKALQKAEDDVFAAMNEKFPGKLLVYIYYKRAQLNDALDETGAAGAPYYEKLVEAAMAEDAVKHKGTISSVSTKLANYYKKVGNAEKSAYYAELAK